MVGVVQKACWVLLLGVLAAPLGCQPAAPIVEEDSPPIGVVQLKITFGSEHADINIEVPCSTDATVFSTLEGAQSQGDLEFQASGNTETMKFVTSINGVANLAGEGDNWVYRVNDQLGDKSSGVYSVKPGDVVYWSFGKYAPQRP